MSCLQDGARPAELGAVHRCWDHGLSPQAGLGVCVLPVPPRGLQEGEMRVLARDLGSLWFSLGLGGSGVRW